MSKYLLSKISLTSFVAITAFLPITACDLAGNLTKIDRTTNSEFQDYRDAFAPREAGMTDINNSSVPDLQSYIADDMSKAKAMPLVSIAINQSIPIREALFELAKQADYDIELDPRIKGSIIFTARNRPFDEVIDKISLIAGLRYKIDENSMRVELDTPYTKTYKLDYLSFVRTNDSSIDTSVSVSAGGNASGGSSFKIGSKSESDFWTELDTNLKQILNSNSSQNYLKTNEDPVLALTSAAPTAPAAANSASLPPVPPIDAAALGAVTPQAGEDYVSDYIASPAEITNDSNASSSNNTTNTTTPATSSTPTVDPVVNPAAPVVQPLSDSAQSNGNNTPAPVLKVESLPTSLAGGGTAAGTNEVIFTPAYSINKQAGLISVYGNERVQRKVAEYLEALRKSTSSQVLIEAKVLEVNLTDEFSAGIDWNLLDDFGTFDIGATFTKPALSPLSTNVITFGIGGQDISSFVSALSRFGTVKALASPRLTVLNNQASVLNVAQNQVYFELKLDVTAATTTSGATTTITSTAKTVPEGVLINVLPSIDLDKRMVSMQIRPTVTKINGYVDDPGVAYVAAVNNISVASQIPIVNVQEIDSVLKIKSGEMIVMGGLLQDNTISTQEGVPMASEIPIIGSLFRNQGDMVKKSELVVFIKATILDEPSQSIHQTDRDIYKTFSGDRRPVKL